MFTLKEICIFVCMQELREVASQAVTVQEAAVTFVEWPLGRKLPVKHERVRAAVQQVSFAARISSLFGAQTWVVCKLLGASSQSSMRE
jgi:hypothetical protein